MTYQKIYAAHVAGNPPLSWPQTTVETFPQYKARMNSLGLQPDITQSLGVFESDAAYEARIATYSYPQDAAAVSKVRVDAANVVGTVASAVSASFATTASWVPTNA